MSGIGTTHEEKYMSEVKADIVFCKSEGGRYDYDHFEIRCEGFTSGCGETLEETIKDFDNNNLKMSLDYTRGIL